MNASAKAQGRRDYGAAGMALIEALVALAVMAFGLLGVVGMQATLRFNSDVSRQRADAVRLAQEQMETLRSFGVISGATGTQRDFVGIATGGDSPTPPSGVANATFTRTWTVFNPGTSDPKMKSVWVEVKWRDRRTATTSVDSAQERVFLASTIAAAPPELAATLGLAGDLSAPQRPRGRNAAIPQAAVDQSDGTSVFAPPGAPSGTTWTFVNATGQITSLCNPAGTCTSVVGWLLSGYINFATGGLPSALEAESPTDPVEPNHTFSIDVVATTTPTPATAPVCFSQNSTSLLIAYYCFVPVNANPATWSGQSLLSIERISDGSNRLASSLSSSSDTRFKVCRYTPQATHTPTGGNQSHPLTYTNVNSSLNNQNFLVTSAGDGSGTAYPCPGDGPDPLINTNTYRHQPSS